MPKRVRDGERNREKKKIAQVLREKNDNKVKPELEITDHGLLMTLFTDSSVNLSV